VQSSGGLVGKNINYIVIQGIAWDSCNGIAIFNFIDANIIECNFLNFIYCALTLQGLGSTIKSCEFIGNLEHSVHCIGSDGLLPKLSIVSSKFKNNTNTAVNIEYCNITLDNVVFYNNLMLI